ncbi:MAG TPA: hypothetical protein VN027_04320, partial [Isoptericola sp.]|nr:hypothetical protein [Isoptericola sp.]
MTRRTFGKLAGITATALLPWAPAPRAAASGPPEVVETDTHVVVDNGLVRLTVDKSNGRTTSLVHDGVNLVGRGNYDMNTVREGGGLPLPPADNHLT